MKSIRFISAAVLVLIVAGCATAPPVVLKTVGPNPSGSANQAATGQLEVFSALDQTEPGGMSLSFPEGGSYWYGIQGEEGNRFGYQHTDYVIYNLDGRRVRHVLNTVNPYEPTPRVVTLPPGKYIVEAKARDAKRVRVPVEVEAGRMSKIHLDDNWKLPVNTPKDELVSLPSGSPVGWRAEP
jgi:hypothetical protein